MRKYAIWVIVAVAAFLRIYQLGSVPPSPYWDEASLGYNAYSILKTGHDEHGKFLPLTNFAAYGDYKPPLYIYAAVPSIAIFGLNEFAIRFPSAFFGTLTVLLTYLLVKKLFNKEEIALLASLFLAISPWHLQFSRAAFEANLGLFFSTLGIYLFLKFAKDNKNWIFGSLLSFVAGMYTFTGQKLFEPFIVLILAIQFRKEVIANWKRVAVAAAISAIIFLPLFKFAAFTQEGKLRFNEVTIFNDLDPVSQANTYREEDSNAWWSNIIHNRRVNYAYLYLIHYFDAFDPSFLFTHGDVNPRLSIQEVGELYYIDLPLVVLGVFFLISKKYKYSFLILGWLVVSPLGPATARETPHALRMIHILPVYQILAAIGAYSLYKYFKYKKFIIAGVALALFANFFYYLHMYYIHWPLNYSDQWQYGYKQAVETVSPLYDGADHVVVSNFLGRPYIYFLLYNKVDPKQFWQKSNVTTDNFKFIHVNSFDKYIFADEPASVKVSGKIIYVNQPGSAPKGASQVIKINDLSGKPVFEIYEVNKS